MFPLFFGLLVNALVNAMPVPNAAGMANIKAASFQLVSLRFASSFMLSGIVGIIASP
jgi:hypothetical protein